MANEVINLPDYMVDYHYVSLNPKFEYKKSCSSIGSTRAAKTLSNFIFELYCTRKQSLRQRLTRRWAK